MYTYMLNLFTQKQMQAFQSGPSFFYILEPNPPEHLRDCIADILFRGNSVL